MLKLNKQLIVGYHEAMATQFNADLLTLGDVGPYLKALEMGSTIAKNLAPAPVLTMLDAFDYLGLNINPVEFLRTTAITAPPDITRGKPLIYVPWTPGVGTPHELAQQCEILAHECQHVVQIHEDPDWLRRYIAEFTYRTKAEKGAFHTNMELRFKLHGVSPGPGILVGNLTKYFLRPTDHKVLIAGLEQFVIPVSEGALATTAGKFAVGWLDDWVTQ